MSEIFEEIEKITLRNSASYAE